jgi:hypothetical protein
MGWLTWILLVVIAILLVAMLCYSVIVTGLEMGRRIQPFANSFFDALYRIMFRRLRNENPPGKSKLT